MDGIRAALQQSSLYLPEDISEEENLFDAGLSSFDLINLIMSLEEICAIEFPLDAMRRENFATITKIRETISALRNKTAAL